VYDTATSHPYLYNIFVFFGVAALGLLDPEDGDIALLQNVDNNLPVNTV
jgi:hypothetical protein